MRFYDIRITDPSGSGKPKTFTSFVNGKTDPGALNIELDLPVTEMAIANIAGYVKIWGISLQDIGQAANLNGKNIQVFGGMKPGLPLANPKQAGLLAQGSILQAFGNWIGVEQSLDIVLAPPFGSNAAPANVSFNWKAGTPLSSALAATLKTAFPNFTQSISISPNLVLPGDQPGAYNSLDQFAALVKAISKNIIRTDGYPGVSIFQVGTQIVVSDGQKSSSGATSGAKQIAFTDLIGQPTWIGLNTIQAKTVMRADIKLIDMVTLPPSIATTTAQSSSQYRQSSAFKGKFMVQRVHHFGNLRQPDATAWNTTFDLVSSAG